MIKLIDKMLTWAGEHFTDLTRGLIAYSLIATAIYMELSGKGAPEWLIGIVGASVVAFYFERMSANGKARKAQ